MPDGELSVLSPIPVHPPVKLISKLTNFMFSWNIAIKILGCYQHPRNQDSGINCGEFGFPRALSTDRIEKMVVKALVARSVWLRTLMAICEKTKCDQGPFHSLIPRDETPFDADRQYCQPKANRGNTGWGVFPGAIQNQPGLRIGLIQKIFEGIVLQLIQHFAFFFFM